MKHSPVGLSAITTTALLVLIWSSTTTTLAQEVDPLEWPAFDAVCENYLALQADLQAALTTWQDPACYEYTLNKFAQVPNVMYTGPFTIQVHNGVVVDHGAGAPDIFNKTMTDFYDWIDKTCISSCPDGTPGTTAYQCQVTFDATTGVPTYMSIDYSALLADEEDLYQIADFQVLDCNPPGTVVSAPTTADDPTCVDYESVQDSLAVARTAWENHPPCYNYTVQQLGNFPVPIGPYVIQVRHGVVMDTGGGDINRTIDDFLDFIYETCVAKCPDDQGSAAYKCNVQYHDNGAPYDVTVDYSAVMADEEVYYRITDVQTTTDCAVVADQRVKSTCVDYQLVQNSWTTAESVWADPPCYQYTVEQIGEFPEPRGPYVIQVQKGVVTDTGGGDINMTINDFYNWIYDTCVAGCPSDGAAYQCNILYHENGAPSDMTVNYDALLADEEDMYRITDFQTLTCPTTSDPPSSTCVDYQLVQNSWTTAESVWADPPCYQYTVEQIGEFPEPRGPYVIQVQNGVVTDTGGGDINMTVNDFYNWIYDTCVAGCPSDGAAYKCNILYHENGAPSDMTVDYDALLADEEDMYRITDFQTLTCPTTSDPPVTTEGSMCVDYQLVQSAWTTAEAVWADPPCYKFTVQQLGDFPEPRGPYVIQVQNRVVTDTGGGDINMTVNDFLAWIDETCVARCPSDGAAYKCDILYHENGAPSDITVDYDALLADEEEMYRITDFSTFTCPTTSDPPVTTVGSTCVDYQLVQSAWTEAEAVWADPPCYKFTVQQLGDFPEPRGPYVIQVQNRVVTDTGGGDINMSVNDFLNWIDETCVARCPSQGSAYKCDILYHENGAPSDITVDYDALLADEEEMYRITDFSTFTCPTTNDPPVTTVGSTCVDYQLVQSAWTEAEAVWADPPCYKFTVQQLGDFPEPRGPYVIQVQNRVVTDTGGGDINMTVNDFLNWIDETCVARCPSQGSAYKCDILYHENGAPSDITVDYDALLADEEEMYRITDFSTFTCPTTNDPPVTTVGSTCVDYQLVQSAWTEAEAVWADPPCYKFTVQQLGDFPEPRGPYVIQVQNGVVTDTGGGDINMSVNDFLNWIDETCVARCPSQGSAYKCDILYHENGAPSDITVDYDALLADEEEMYRITDFSTFTCPTTNDPPVTTVGSTCVDYQLVQSAWTEAEAVWADPPCYKFTVEQLGDFPEPRGPYVIQVQNGVVTDTGGGDINMTVNDFLAWIDDTCVARCPSQGSPYKCDILYHENGAPSDITVDYDALLADEEEMYRITDFSTVSCPGVIDPPSTYDTKCVDAQSVEQRLSTARTAWSSPACYEYTVERVGDFPEPQGPYVVQVRNGVVMDSGGGDISFTIDDFFDMIDENCLQGCQTGNAAYKCQVTYRDDGTPVDIMIDYDGLTADEEDLYRITNLQTIECNMGVTPDDSHCVGYEKVQNALDAAEQAWKSAGPPACYTYSIERLGRILEEYRGPFTVMVADQVATVVEGFEGANMDLTLDEWFAAITQRCLEGCPSNENAAYQCTTEFDETIGYPLSMTFDYQRDVADEEEMFVISNFAVSTCPSSNGNNANVPMQPSEETVSRCVNYEQVRSSLTSARKTWSDRACYDFVVQRFGEILPQDAGPFNVTVRNGVMTDTGGGSINFTVNDFFDMIEEKCLAGCPDGDGAYQCQIIYREDGAPFDIVIDNDNLLEDDEDLYRITNLNIVDCNDGDSPEDEGATGGNRCVNYKTAKANLQAAEQAWSEPKCYTYTMTRSDGEVADTGVTVLVLGGAAFAPDASKSFIPMTMQELLAEFGDACVEQCPEEGAVTCRGTFAEEGYILSAVIDFSENGADEKTVYTVSDFEIVDCDSDVFSSISSTTSSTVSVRSCAAMMVVSIFSLFVLLKM